MVVEVLGAVHQLLLCLQERTDAVSGDWAPSRPCGHTPGPISSGSRCLEGKASRRAQQPAHGRRGHMAGGARGQPRLWVRAWAVCLSSAAIRVHGGGLPWWQVGAAADRPSWRPCPPPLTAPTCPHPLLWGQWLDTQALALLWGRLAGAVRGDTSLKAWVPKQGPAGPTQGRALGCLLNKPHSCLGKCASSFTGRMSTRLGCLMSGRNIIPTGSPQGAQGPTLSGLGAKL